MSYAGLRYTCSLLTVAFTLPIGLGWHKLQAGRFEERVASHGSSAPAQTERERHSPNVRAARPSRTTRGQL